MYTDSTQNDILHQEKASTSPSERLTTRAEEPNKITNISQVHAAPLKNLYLYKASRMLFNVTKCI